jgi:dienelactone hydrolase
MDEIRQDILDGYKWILNDMNGTIARDLDVSRVICMGWSAGATASLLLVSVGLAQMPTLQRCPLNVQTSTPRQAADVATQGLPQFKAIIATYPLTNANTTHNEPISEWYDNVSKDEQEEIMSLFDEPVETSFVPE